ncbi:ubiquitin conjugation factor [Pseudozyma hubeiensis SY62]|uniref:Ubiquitin conjugation factor n=1 Tax=Pseudozyma hubeiensis (strain SY62) TaxID=1305764 RepID=R9NVY4_PSEHS|nr:ubiquitin conjugation factor [Pseudozyma hubeiensis SY62]GAC92649.1 ubiquitin conjugation factor [Pseudozyma hubeiensis SY62]
MSAILGASSSLLSQDNLWSGPAAASTSRVNKPATSRTRAIRRKPVPLIPAELLQQHTSSSSISTASTPTAPISAASRSATVGTKPAQPAPAKPAQKPQRQYLLEIDAPTISREDRATADESVRQLLRSATVSTSTGPSRPRKGPLKWAQDKEEHAAAASTSSLPPRNPTLSRKTSISAHLKMSLRRNKVEEQPCFGLNISAPTDFVHISTGSEGAKASPISLRRSSTTSPRSSLRSSMSSTSSGVSFGTADSSPHEDAAKDDKPLYEALERKYPLRPLKSIRRPTKISVDLLEPTLSLSKEPTSPKDKRKGIYAAPGLVPDILEPVDSMNHIAAPNASRAGEHFAAALDRSIGRTRGRTSDASELSPEPELSRSPSSGYDSSTCASNRSSLGSLHEFRTFLDFPDMEASARGKADEDMWSGSALAAPIVLPKF